MCGKTTSEGCSCAIWADNATWTRQLEAQRLEAADEGRFAIEGVPPGLPELTLIVGRGLSQLETRPIGPFGPPGSTLEVDWQLAPRVRGEVRGVLSLNGAPHSGEVWWQQGSAEGFAIADALLGHSHGVFERAWESDGLRAEISFPIKG